MTITQQDKEGIAKKAKAMYFQHNLSYSKVETQTGVSKTAIVWMFSDDEVWKEKSISDAKWMQLAEWAGYDFNTDEIKVIRTFKNFTRFYNICKEAHNRQGMKIISESHGRGKTTALESYRDDNKVNAYYLECDPSMIQSVFLTKLGELLGLRNESYNNINSRIEAIVKKIYAATSPIILLDEWNELPKASKRVLKTLLNRLKGKCAFVICGGNNLRKDLKSGLSRAEQSYEEIYSRGGGEILGGYQDTDQKAYMNRVSREVTEYCMVNGIDDQSMIMETINNFDGDWRPVKNRVLDYKALMKKRLNKAKNGVIPSDAVIQMIEA